MTKDLVHLPTANSSWVMGSGVESGEVVPSGLVLRAHLHHGYSQAKCSNPRNPLYQRVGNSGTSDCSRLWELRLEARSLEMTERRTQGEPGRKANGKFINK